MGYHAGIEINAGEAMQRRSQAKRLGFWARHSAAIYKCGFGLPIGVRAWPAIRWKIGVEGGGTVWMYPSVPLWCFSA